MFGNRKNDRREHVRLRPDRSLRLEAIVLDPQDREILRARVLDASAGGAAIQVTSEEAEGWVRGQRMRVRFTGASVDVPVTTVATVASVRPEAELEGLLRVGLAFLDRAGLEGQFDASWWRLFNRRGALRMLLAQVDGEEVELGITASGVSLRSSLHDLCVDGVGFELEPADAEHLRQTEELRLGFSLGDSGQRLLFVVAVRHVTPVARVARVGTAFLPDRSPDFDRRSRVVAGHVVDLQRIELQRRAELEAE
jgi:hypothetical protein